MLAVIFECGRRSGKMAAQKKQLHDFVDDGLHVHEVHTNVTICWNGNCPPLRRANGNDREMLHK